MDISLRNNKIKTKEFLKSCFFKLYYVRNKLLEHFIKWKKGKRNIVFLATLSENWTKFDFLYQKFLQDDRYNTYLVLSPIYNKGKAFEMQEVKKLINLFDSKGYQYINLQNHNIKEYLCKTIKPDLFFYSSPYLNQIHPDFSQLKYIKALTCYIPYSFMASEEPFLYNMDLHNLCWKFFLETKLHKKLAVKFQSLHGTNVVVTGYPGLDQFLYGKAQIENKWLNNNISIKKIIWAPHQAKLENFESLGTFLMEYSDMNKNSIQIAMKPHPLLRDVLYKTSGWGKTKTDKFFDKWCDSDNRLIVEGDYSDLFLTSDAMIHNSYSFMTEYVAMNKPVMYYLGNEKNPFQFSDYGNAILKCHYHAFEMNDVKKFIEGVVFSNQDILLGRRTWFINKLLKNKNGLSASEAVKEYIDSRLLKKNSSC